jgi:hypothetical protein
MAPHVRMITPPPPASYNRISSLTPNSVNQQRVPGTLTANCFIPLNPLAAGLVQTATQHKGGKAPDIVSYRQLTMMTPLKSNRGHLKHAGHSMKTLLTIGLGFLLLTVAACTEVSVSVRVPSTSSVLTGTNCKLQRELTNQNQQTDFWCWAASAHTVIEYIKNEKIDQCILVDAVKRAELDREWDRIKGGDPPPIIPLEPPPNCCMSTLEMVPQPESTNVGAAQKVCWTNGWPELVFKTSEFRMNYEGYEYDPNFPGPQGLSWDEIVTEICEDRPMISAIYFSKQFGGGTHTVVIGGYSELEDGSQWIQVYDPGFNTNEDDYYIWPYDVYLGDPGVFTHVRDYKGISLP